MPSEIRNRIYEFALDLQSKQLHHHDKYDWNRLNVARASRQLFAETADNYFRSKILPFYEKRVCFWDLEAMQRIIAELTQSQRRAIREVMVDEYTVRYWHASDREPCALRDLPHLLDVQFRHIDLDSHNPHLASFRRWAGILNFPRSKYGYYKVGAFIEYGKMRWGDHRDTGM